MQKSKQKQSQDFFPRSGKSDKTKGFIFNQAPINKREAQQQVRENLESGVTQKKRSAFVARLYQDDDQFDDEMKVFDMDRQSSEDEGEVKVTDGKKKRQAKEADKKGKGSQVRSKSAAVGSSNKVNRLKFSPGSVGLFAIAEVHPKYLMVNYTRNTKGYISLADKSEDYHKHFEVGQYVVAAVIRHGTSLYTEQSSNQNKKLQLSLAMDLINKSLTAETISPNMILQGEIESKEAKGYLINFGLKDRSKGFLPLNEQSEHFQLQQVVLVQVKSVIPASKVIKCEIPDSGIKTMNNKDSTIHNLKPGYLINGKVSTVMENGIEVSFLTGFKGTVFIDHLEKNEPTKYKSGEKLNARIIYIDPQTQTISLTMSPHLMKLQNTANSLQQDGFKVGKVFDNAKVSKVAFGSSYKINLGHQVEGFLHKIHAVKLLKSKDADDDTPQYEKLQLEPNQKLDRIRVKELNYFDGCPILSMREDIVTSDALNYDTIQCGMIVSAVIEDVNDKDKYVLLRLNDFVKGRLYLEHIADFPLKTIPPKFTQLNKTIKVRVFEVDAPSRYIEFTKKESLMKSKAPVYQTYKETTKGSKVVGLIVGENEHGYIVKTFGSIKALLTFSEIKAHVGKKREYKLGGIVKAYVLFKKKDKGVALTLDRAKAKELRKEAEEKSGKKTISDNDQAVSLEQYLPSHDEVSVIKEKYKSMIKQSGSNTNIGKVMQFRITETNEKYFVCKSLDAAKKALNIVAVLPLILVNKHHLPALTLEDSTFQALIIDVQDNAVSVISAQQELLSLKDKIPSANTDFKNVSNNAFVGIVSDVSKKGVTVQFYNGLKKVILVKDLETTQDFSSVYTIGKVVRTAHNKLERLCLKNTVVYHSNTVLQQADKELQIKSFYEQIASLIQYHKIKIGDEIEAEISLVKDYGNIVSVEKYPGLTGFILTEHLLPNKSYNEGQKITCVVMDIDFEKEILDLSEKLADKSGKSKTIKAGTQQKAVVELNKEDYLLVSFKQSKSSIGLLMMQSFNNDKVPNPNEKYQMGDEIDVKVIEISESGFILTVPVEEKAEVKAKTPGEKKEHAKLEVGTQVKGQIRSIKGQNVFLQLAHQSQLMIGRLNRMECQSTAEYEGFTVGESIDAKILQISQDNKKTWIELTRRKEHMKYAHGLDPVTLKSTILSLEDLKNGQSYPALITDVNYSYSQPLHIELSPFVKGAISFENIVSQETLIKEGSGYLQKFKEGAAVKVHYHNGQFTLTPTIQQKQKKFEKGDLIVARFVKAVNGKGITVQINQKVFGFIEICEVTDDIVGRVIDNQFQTQPLFVARIVDFDKNDKPILSSRDSVVDQTTWELIAPSGKSLHFQKFDEKSQSVGNQRNKILKYGAQVALQANDLALGYITNINKAGCFIQVGHNCTVRAGLNELFDQASYDFTSQMPLGRLVLARIYRVDDVNGQKRFSASLRKSMVVYGVNAVDRDVLQEGAQIQAVVLAKADDKYFAQVKGSYLKVKVKEVPTDKKIKEGENIIVTLTKVTKQKIVGTYDGKAPSQEMSESERKIQKIWSSVEEESQKDIEAMKVEQVKAEIDQEALVHLGVKDEDEIDMQLRDLKELEEDESMEVVQNDDSDEEEMQRIIRESKVYEDKKSDDDEDEDMEDESEQKDDDDEDVYMNDDSDEEAASSDDDQDHTKKLSGKKSLKNRIKEEQEIRKKEKQLRENTLQPTSVEDYERLLVQNQDQSYVWIQYMAFMLDKLGMESARRIAERAVKSVSISNEEDKFNIWVAYMNLENNFGNQATMEKIVKRALEVNDRKKIYLQLIGIYQNSQKYQYIEDIYKQLCKKFNTSLKIWTGYLEFLFLIKHLKTDKDSAAKFLVHDLEVAEPKSILQKSLQSLPKDKHVNMISKFGMLEFKHGQPENGRTMFEGIVSNYPKRMDIWAIYMDMEVKYGGDNKQQARHLFERCLSNELIKKKPKKMKLVFQKYMEYETQNGNKKNVEKLRERVEQYLETAFTAKKAAAESDSE